MATDRTAMRGRYFRLRDFFSSGIWSLRLEELPRRQAVGIRLLRVLSTTVNQFFGDQCMLRASALTFYTLLSVVPILAVFFGIAKGFGLEKLLERELMEQMAGQEALLERILTFARNMLDNTKGGLIAGVGVALMFWSAIKVMGQIESALNAMWDVPQSRSWVRRFSDYLAIMLLAPILFLVAGSTSLFVRTQFAAIAERFEILGTLGPLVIYALKLTPIILVWALFTLIYMAMPNTRVPFGAAATGAAVAGLLYQMVQWIYIDLQVGVASQNAIYGSFAALPLFLAWVQTSWTIVLFGAELVYAVQHAAELCSATGCPAAAPAERRLIGLQIVRKSIERFSGGDSAMTARELAHATGIPLPLVRQAARDLVATGILSETAAGAPGERALQPAMDIRLLTLQRVADALDSAGGATVLLNLPADDSTAELRNALQKLSQAAAESPVNRLLKDIK